MLTCPLASPDLVSSVLGSFLLLAALPTAQNTGWDRPSCTPGVVSVSRGQRAVLTCNISNAFIDVSIELKKLGEGRTIFSEVPPGHFSLDGWQLHIEGGCAQLVIEAARDDQAGQYRWHLHGRQRSNINISLNVSEPEDEKQLPEMEMTTSPGGARSRPVITVLVVCLMPVLAVLLLVVLYYQRRPLQQCPSQQRLQNHLGSAEQNHLQRDFAARPSEMDYPVPGTWSPSEPL